MEFIKKNSVAIIVILVLIAVWYFFLRKKESSSNYYGVMGFDGGESGYAKDRTGLCRWCVSRDSSGKCTQLVVGPCEQEFSA